MTQHDPMLIVDELVQLPHRGTATPAAGQARDMLRRRLEEIGATVEAQSFRTPPTYLTIVGWFVGGQVLGLLLLFVSAWAGFVLVSLSALSAWLYFDWRRSPAAALPPQVTAHNLIGRFNATSDVRKRLILMAHYDTAPISYLYRPEMVKGFTRSLRISVGVIVVAEAAALLALLDVEHIALSVLRVLLMIYFLIQFVLSSIDYFRFGYSNGASDNTSGVAVVLSTAGRLIMDLPPNWVLDVVLTDAEEVGMIGAHAYYQASKADLTENTYLLNIDTVGVGQLKIMTETGGLTNISYDNALVDAAKHVAAHEPRFADIKTAQWRTGDFDTARFARGGVPCLTLGALDEQGSMPNIHRPEDTITNVEPATVRYTVDFAEALARRLMSSV